LETGEIRDVEEILERHTSKDWSKRNKCKVRTTRLPPKGLPELSKVITEAISNWKTIIHLREADIST
jgi:hypothetical protein